MADIQDKTAAFIEANKAAIGKTLSSARLEVFFKVTVPSHAPGGHAQETFCRNQVLAEAVLLHVKGVSGAEMKPILGIAASGYVVEIKEAHEAILLEDDPDRLEALKRSALESIPRPFQRLLGIG